MSVPLKKEFTKCGGCTDEMQNQPMVLGLMGRLSCVGVVAQRVFKSNILCRAFCNGDKFYVRELDPHLGQS